MLYTVFSMEQDFYYIELFDIYKGLLTDKQRENFYSHYILDLSLSEVSESEGGTRQSVHDALKKVKAKLDELESVLKIREKNSQLNEVIKKIDDKEIRNKIKEIIGK